MLITNEILLKKQQYKTNSFVKTRYLRFLFIHSFVRVKLNANISSLWLYKLLDN